MSLGDNLTFKPLYWIYHDTWFSRLWRPVEEGWAPTYHKHRGHMHFFMLGQNQKDGQQAYSGEQIYSFKLDDEWSPRLDRNYEPNKQENIKIIGSPKWYFWIREWWRRVYIQPWENKDNDTTNKFIIGKKGIKYDASKPRHTYGPFREGKGNFFKWSDMARTLPIEYYHDENLTIRDHFLRKDDIKTSWNKKWNYDESSFFIVSDTKTNPSGVYSPTKWIIPRDSNYAGRPLNHWESGDGPIEDSNARRSAYPDSNYIYPTIEYQYMQQLDWERDYGWEDRENGDGFSVNISIPFKINGIIQSPFSDDEGNVSVPGVYYHNFESKHPEHILKYAEYSKTVSKTHHSYDNIVFDALEYNIPASGTKLNWHIPSGFELDGFWVEQCLGAIVKAKALVTIEDNFGKQYEIWVDSSQFMIQDNFEGSDQNEGAN